MDGDAWNHAVWDLVDCIPKGYVATYGQLARILGYPRRARHVGRALRLSPEERALPWHRVINARGGISHEPQSFGYIEQSQLLREEGILVNDKGLIDLKRFQWRP